MAQNDCPTPDVMVADIIGQVVGTFKKLGEYFYDNNQWYFWWD